MDHFQQAMTFVSLHEWGNRADGGYTNNPTDPGGETKYGIAERSHPNVDIKNLTLADAYAIYKSEYWDANNLDPRPFPYNVALFDSYIQHNPNHVVDWDKQANGDRRAFLELRRSYYLRIISQDPKLNAFRNGWMNRLNDLSKYCDILDEQQQWPSRPVQPQTLFPTG